MFDCHRYTWKTCSRPNVRYNLNIGNLLADFHMQQLAFYAQDQWKITPQFQINFGLRWEGQWNPQPVANNTAVVQTIQATTFPLNGKYDPTRTQNNLNQWMPPWTFPCNYLFSGETSAGNYVLMAAKTTKAAAASDEAMAEQLGPLIAHTWSLATALSLLAWFVFAPQCISTLAAVRRETNGWRIPALMMSYLFTLAYVAAWITYRVALAWGA